ncbi:hypothetical protein B0H13DRAFT_1868438 [Mycena leptocephala]|nr:hypothetical protein B0H13DRAFT_1868438 [Mycena leptocephala]
MTVAAGQPVPNGALSIASSSSSSSAFIPKTPVRIKRKRVVPDTPSKRRRSADYLIFNISLQHNLPTSLNDTRDNRVLQPIIVVCSMAVFTHRHSNMSSQWAFEKILDSLKSAGLAFMSECSYGNHFNLSTELPGRLRDRGFTYLLPPSAGAGRFRPVIFGQVKEIVSNPSLPEEDPVFLAGRLSKWTPSFGISWLSWAMLCVESPQTMILSIISYLREAIMVWFGSGTSLEDVWSSSARALSNHVAASSCIDAECASSTAPTVPEAGPEAEADAEDVVNDSQSPEHADWHSLAVGDFVLLLCDLSRADFEEPEGYTRVRVLIRSSLPYPDVRLRGVGIFCWGGFSKDMEDNGTIGVPYTEVAPIKWRLGDTCLALLSESWMHHSQYVEDILSDKSTAFGLSSYPTDFAATRDMTLNGGSYYSYKSRHSVLPLEIPGKRYSPRFRGVVIGTVIGQELTAGGQGVNVRLSLPVGCTEEVKVLFKKQTTLLREVESVDSGDRPSAKTEGVIITGAAEIEDLIISVKANILRWTETGFFPNGSNLAMRVSLTRLDSVEGGLSNSRKKHVDHRVYLLIAESYRILEGNAFGTQEVEMDCLDVDDLSDLA